MNLTVRQLISFREVMRTGSISEAARNLNRTQPSLSSMIANLESELKFKLFIRRSGKLIPTSEAQFVLEEAKSILSRIESASAVFSGVSKLNRGKLRIACYPAGSSFLMPDILQKFLLDKPKLEASIMMRSSQAAENLIASQQFDLGLIERPEARHSFKQKNFAFDCVCAISTQDPLSKAEAVSCEDLKRKPLAMLFSEHQTAKKTINAFKSSNTDYWARFELQTFLPGLKLVESNLCFMICDMITAYSYLYLQGVGNQKIVFRPFLPRIVNEISIVWPAHRPISLPAKSIIPDIENRLLEIPSAIKAE